MKFHETIIIGAGPGGLACALTLARQGRDVLLLEKKQHIGSKVCAGGVTWSGFLNRLPAELIERTFSSQYIRSNWQETTISSPSPMIATVNRLKMGQWQSSEASKAGVKILTDTIVSNITDTEVTTNQGNFRYRYLVGADGSTSMVRDFLGLPSQNIGVGIHYEVQGDFPRMEWHMQSNLLKSGYAWIFPHRDHASIGAYSCRQGLSAKKLHERLLLWANGQKIKLGKNKPRAAIINFDFKGWRFANRFLVGDAAGLASGLTGEGIFPAILSGETVANTIMGEDRQGPELGRLLQKHHIHQLVLKLAGSNRFTCTAIMELLVTALRLKIIPWHALEMGE